jgi:hypothetical protein
VPGGKQRSQRKGVVRLRPRHDHRVSRISATAERIVAAETDAMRSACAEGRGPSGSGLLRRNAARRASKKRQSAT